MKVGKVIGIGCGSLVGVGALALLGGWFLYIRAPSPEAQCDHLVGLMRKETKLELGDKFRAECVAKAQKGEMEGLIPYAERSKCVVAAETLDQADKCGKNKS